MNVFFAALHLAYFRNFDSVVRELSSRGHRVHLAVDEPEALGGERLAEQLASEHEGVTWGILPSLEAEPWFDAARRLRVSLDHVRVLDRRYPRKLRLRTEERTARLVRWASHVPALGPPLTRRALTAIEDAMPASPLMVEYLRRQAPDVVVLASLTYSRSQQLDVLKAARALGIPVAAAIMSWDHLSSKALLHVAPDRVIVWNDVQVREAVEMHGLPADRLTVTGAQCYDQWFSRQPSTDRRAFCEAVGLTDDRPFVLWVHSALSPTPEPPEPVLVTRWIEALRSSTDPRLRDVGVLVRPHPERMKEWAGIDLRKYPHVAFRGRNPIDGGSRDEYFDSLYHSHAVVGLVTSAFLEAAVVGRPVLTFRLPEYRMHQEEMIHFRYLEEVGGGLLHGADDIPAHLSQLAAAIALDRSRDERNRRFVQEFIRPFGLDRPATPIFADAVESLVKDAGKDGVKDDVRTGPTRRPTPGRGPWLRPTVLAMAARSRSGLGRWLMNDERTDAWDDHEVETQRAVDARLAAKDAWHREKARRKAQRWRRDVMAAIAKRLRSTGRQIRHRAAVSVHRVLHVTRLRRRSWPDAGAGR